MSQRRGRAGSCGPGRLPPACAPYADLIVACCGSARCLRAWVLVCWGLESAMSRHRHSRLGVPVKAESGSSCQDSAMPAWVRKPTFGPSRGRFVSMPKQSTSAMCRRNSAARVEPFSGLPCNVTDPRLAGPVACREGLNLRLIAVRAANHAGRRTEVHSVHRAWPPYANRRACGRGCGVSRLRHIRHQLSSTFSRRTNFCPQCISRSTSPPCGVTRAYEILSVFRLGIG